MSLSKTEAARPALPGAAKNAGSDYGRTASPSWRAVDWQAHSNSVRLSQGTVSYVDLPGPGGESAVVFVHGLGGCWQNWLETLPRVAESRRAIALDLPGFGASPMPQEPISISGYARIVAEFCDVLGIERFAVVGNSMGGFIAAELGITISKRLDCMVLVSAAGISSTALARSPALTAMRASAVVGAYAVARRRAIARRPRLRHAFMATVVRHPTLLSADLVYEQLRGMGKPGFHPALDALISYDFRERLDEIACPVAVLWGADDVLVPVADAHRFERRIPDVRKKVVLEDTGHVPMLERPETFNAELIEFLDSVADSAEDRLRSQPTAPA